MVFVCCCSPLDPTYDPIATEESHDSMQHSLAGKVRAKEPTKSPEANYEQLNTMGNASPFRDGPESTPTVASVAPKEPRSDDNLIAVMVPWGVYGGQTIRVMYPDGSGRQVDAKVPMGMTAGSIFHIKVDLKRQHTTRSYANVEPMPPPARVTPDPSSNCLNKLNRQKNPHRHTTNNTLSPRPVTSNDIVPFSQCLDDIDPMEPRHTPHNPQKYHPQSPRSDTARLLRVKVPSNAKVGSTVHVQIPEEDRFIATRIPPNCTEFHVQYEPKPSVPPSAQVSPCCSWNHLEKSDPRQRYRTTTSPLAPRPVTSTDPVPFSQCLDDIDPMEPQHKPKNTQNYQSQLPTSDNARLLRVKVPSNAKFGSTVHVQIPGEARFIASQIPPNCTEFYIQYQPKPSISTQVSPCCSWKHLEKSGPRQQYHTTTSPPVARPVSTNDPVPFSQCLDDIDPLEPPQDTRHNSKNNYSHVPSSDNARLLSVKVPPSVKAGSSIHIKIPGDHRFIAAQVPPNCSEFHVQYKPEPEPTSPMPTPLPLPPESSNPRCPSWLLMHFPFHQQSSTVSSAHSEKRQDS